MSGRRYDTIWYGGVAGGPGGRVLVGRNSTHFQVENVLQIPHH